MSEMAGFESILESEEEDEYYSDEDEYYFDDDEDEFYDDEEF